MKKWNSAVGSMLVVASFGVAGGAFAQEGDLDVTMRVLDDVSDIDAVVLDLSGGAEAEDERESNDRGAETSDDRSRNEGDEGDEHEARGDDLDGPDAEDDREEHLEHGLDDHEEEHEPEDETDVGDDPVDEPDDDAAE
jgi:hypothetical protein